jgi:hypothetical protein
LSPRAWIRPTPWCICDEEFSNVIWDVGRVVIGDGKSISPRATFRPTTPVTGTLAGYYREIADRHGCGRRAW